jgi:hypothetical protein
MTVAIEKHKDSPCITWSIHGYFSTERLVLAIECPHYPATINPADNFVLDIEQHSWVFHIVTDFLSERIRSVVDVN